MKNKELSILLITEDFPPMLGGVATFLHNICLNSKTDISVLTLGVQGDRESDRKLPYKVERVKLRKHMGMLIVFFKLFGTVFRKKPDMILWGDYNSALVVSLLLKLLFGIRIAVLVHGTCFNTSLVSTPIGKALASYNLNRCDLILANSDYTRNRILNMGVAGENVKVLYPGVDISWFCPGVKYGEIVKKYGLSASKIMLTIARLVKKKNHETVLKVIPEIVKYIPSLVYVIVGDGPERDNLRGIIDSLKINKHVIFINSPSLSEYPMLYNACDVFVMPSRTSYIDIASGLRTEDAETFGMVFCEANACGKGVIGGRSGGVPEAVIDGDTGLLVDPENEREVKDALLKLLLNPDLARKMGDRGRERIEREFTWDRIAKRFDGEMEAILR